jgi:hypothetical protein
LEHRHTKVFSGERASVYNHSTVACVNKKHHFRRWIALAEGAIIRRRVLAELGHSPFPKQLASKTQFNGVGRLRTYISLTHLAF